MLAGFASDTASKESGLRTVRIFQALAFPVHSASTFCIFCTSVTHKGSGKPKQINLQDVNQLQVRALAIVYAGSGTTPA